MDAYHDLIRSLVLEQWFSSQPIWPWSHYFSNLFKHSQNWSSFHTSIIYSNIHLDYKLSFGHNSATPTSHHRVTRFKLNSQNNRYTTWTSYRCTHNCCVLLTYLALLAGINSEGSIVRHCGLLVSAPAWNGTGCEFDSWQCRIYIPCSQNLRLHGSLRGSLGTYGFTQKLC